MMCCFELDLAISRIGNSARQAAAKADVVSLSLRSDAELPTEIRVWIETWSELFADNHPALVLLLNQPQTSKTCIVGDYLQGVTDKVRIDFFAGAAFRPSRYDSERPAAVRRSAQVS
jgi:hypothetical protein